MHSAQETKPKPVRLSLLCRSRMPRIEKKESKKERNNKKERRNRKEGKQARKEGRKEGRKRERERERKSPRLFHQCHKHQQRRKKKS